MKILQLLAVLTLGACAAPKPADDSQKTLLLSPDQKTEVALAPTANGSYAYSVKHEGHELLLESPLGFRLSDFDTKASAWHLDSLRQRDVKTNYTLDRSKVADVYVDAKESILYFTAGQLHFSITFHISNNDIAFRYDLPQTHPTGSVRVMEEYTGYHFPSQTTTFLTPQSDAMIGWKRTKPSYEEPYKADAKMSEPSMYGHGYTFPGLFRVGNDGWVLLCETGVDSRYCGSRLSECKNDTYTVAYPMAEENNGNGTSEPAFALPGSTPWRTITVGTDLKPIVETTIMWDVVEPLYEASAPYTYGKGTWSWILWQDGSINYDDQVRYIDLSAAMGFQYVLIDNWWDTYIGHEKIEELVKYAQSKGVDVFLWYSSSGWWNDIEQGPTDIMPRAIARKAEMRWMNKIGVKGIKVDFFGGDKQETMRTYEDILSDANDNHLMVIFHGCTIPRGWERMYPNYVGSEAVLASENLIFGQGACDAHPFNSCLHPFIRNTIGCMEFGGTFLNKRLNRTNDGGTVRKTTDIFELATAVLFQNPIQNFAIAPNNLENDSLQACRDFLTNVPTTWDETRFVDGYPGQYVVIGRRKGDTWYYAGVNATNDDVIVRVPFTPGDKISFLVNGSDDESTQKTDDAGMTTLTEIDDTSHMTDFDMPMKPNSGIVVMVKMQE